MSVSVAENLDREEELQAKVSLVEGLAVIKKYRKNNKVRGQLIEKLVSELYYVDQCASIKELVEDFNKIPGNQVVAVVKNGMEIVGVIERKKLFNVIAKPFGRDILENKKIHEIMENEVLRDLISNLPYFYVESNVFSVVEDLKNALESKEVKYFMCAKNNKEYAGIFTNIDVLFYLSSITQADLEIAQQLQNTIVKDKTYLKEKRFELIAGSKMAKGVGGDFYYIKRIPDSNKWVLSLCDVSGKGVSAALVTAVLGGLFSIYNFAQGYGSFIKKMNEYILSSFNMEKYLTGVFIKLDDETGKVKLYDMGHAYVYVYRNKNLYKFKSHDNNVPIGFVPEIEPVANHFALQKNDILFTLTDGINEQPNSEGVEYGLNRILEIMENNRVKNFDKMIELMFADIKKFRGYHPQHDDMTILILKYLG